MRVSEAVRARGATVVRLLRVRTHTAGDGDVPVTLQLFAVYPPGSETLAPHYVMLDRHGWHCSHGAVCPSVSIAQQALARGDV